MRRVEIFITDLPAPTERAYFPPNKNDERYLALTNEVRRRAGEENFAAAFAYGSFVTGDATKTSIRDMMIIVKNTEDFHRRNMELSPSDYAYPRSARWHAVLNNFGFNFYHTAVPSEDNDFRVKYAVISEENFIRGCGGTLRERELAGQGAFGFNVAGRVQKVTLVPLYIEDTKRSEIERAINTARIDGAWMALGLIKEEFSFNRLMATYTALSYFADIRPERRGKLHRLLQGNEEDYRQMLNPILDEFEARGYIEELENGKYKKLRGPEEREVRGRLAELKIITAGQNYVKNLLTAGIFHGLKYAMEKIKRSRQK